MTEKQDFLFELGTEELPPKALRLLSQSLAEHVRAGLAAVALEYQDIIEYASPRRLALLVKALQARQPDKLVERRGPALAAAFDDDGNPTKAALGFASSCGVDVNLLQTVETDKGAWLVHHSEQAGQSVHELLPEIISTALAKLPIPKRMRWGSLTVEFVRPVHWVVMLFGNEIIAATILGVGSGRETRGHRFHHPELMYLAEPEAYAPLLESEGQVMVDFASRREAIRGQVLAAAVAVAGRAVIDDDLLDEVTAMVEWPVAVLGDFDARFLEVPSEVLISAMKSHQKYFHVVDEAGALLPHFITVSNIVSRDPAVVRSGNERVIRPRLADAAFFWDQDRKRPLADRVQGQKNVVFQKKLGTLYDKTQRVRRLAAFIAEAVGSDRRLAERAAYLAKCDLLTDMVGEFPDLQGIMGRYYAGHDGEPAEVAQALDEQYAPRFAGDALPASATGQVLALADKLDTLAGMFSIKAIPSGSKDPFALRRAALGVLRTVIERSLAAVDLEQLVRQALQAYAADDAATVNALFDFMMDRLRIYYHNQNIDHDVFAAVLARRPLQPLDFDARIRAVMQFRALPEAASLSAAHKRINNILKQAGQVAATQCQASLFSEDAEQHLYDRLSQLADQVQPLLAQRDYTAALVALAALREPVDAFFDSVMVMVDDLAVRANRLALMYRLQQLFLQIADLSCLQGKAED